METTGEGETHSQHSVIQFNVDKFVHSTKPRHLLFRVPLAMMHREK